MSKQIKICPLLLVLTVSSIAPVFANESVTSEDPEAAYTRVITQRAAKIVATLGITDSTKANQIRDIIARQYRSLREIHDSRDAQLKGARTLMGDNKKAAQAREKKIRETAQTRQDKLHSRFLKKLSAGLIPEQVDPVKKGEIYTKNLKKRRRG